MKQAAQQKWGSIVPSFQTMEKLAAAEARMREAEIDLRRLVVNPECGHADAEARRHELTDNFKNAFGEYLEALTSALREQGKL